MAFDGKSLGVSDECWHRLKRFAPVLSHRKRAPLMEALCTYVTPHFQTPVTMEEFAAAIQRYIDSETVKIPLPEEEAEDEPENVANKRISMSDAGWDELLRVATVFNCGSRSEFVEMFTEQIVPLFSHLSSVKDLAIVAVQINEAHGDATTGDSTTADGTTGDSTTGNRTTGDATTNNVVALACAPAQSESLQPASLPTGRKRPDAQRQLSFV